ncbi:MAG: hypothetical protein ACOC2W_02500, partial [bacterium]
MNKKYYLLFILLIILGIGISFINYYSFDYLFSTYIKREFTINPRAEIRSDKNYTINIWYNPFYRTIESLQGKEKKYFEKIEEKVKTKYPNIELELKEINFLESKKIINNSIENREPPDIYLNFTGNNLINKEFQVPVDNYLTAREKEYFSIFKIEEKIWGWPLLIQPQIWLANNEKIEINENADNFFESVNSLEETDLVLNYRDYTLLKQLLSLKGLDQIYLNEENELSEEVL